MNKHNIIELFDYKKNKDKVKNEHDCFAMLDGLKDRIKMSKTYAASFKQYVVCMVKNDCIKKQFADSLIMQVDMIMEAAAEEFSSKGKINDKVL